MRTPTTKIGKYRVRYIQVPYDNRYFCIDLEWYGRYVTIAQIPCDVKEVFHTFLVAICGDEIGSRQNQIDRFYSNVEQKDEHLDRDETFA